MHSFLRISSILLAFLCSLDRVWAHEPPSPFGSYEYGIDRNTILKRQSPSSFAINGIHTGTGPGGSLPLRLEIRDLEKDNTTWTLYLLGLDMLQSKNQAEMLSWYRLTGIHGRPYLPFDNVQATPGNGDNGYCTHVSILFPTWHRPYLALYEQVLYGLIQQIAQLYPAGPVRDQYVAAAANFRIPYWDWAAVPANGQSSLPASVQSPSVAISGPSGAQTIANPLFSYKFNPLDPQQLPNPPFDVFTETKRYPTSQDASAQSQNNLVAQQLDNSASSFRSRLYNLFTNYHNYSTFSNEALIPSNNPNGYDSIESVHDQIHGLTGNGGHMSYIDYSAFDPLFFLHHTMIDRCFAMWQVINPNSYVVPEPATYSTFTNSAGDTQDSTSPLTPFHADASGKFWTSDSVRSAGAFGYAYPETANSTGVNVTTQVIGAINKLYGSTSNTASKLRRSEGSIGSRDVTLNGNHHEWVANIRVKKSALDAPFFIHIFLGDFNNDPASWSFESNLVGTHCVFTKASMGSSNCSCDPDQIVTATIPLTEAMLAKIANKELASLEPEDAVIYVADNLKYRITLLDDSEVDNGNVPSMEISVASVEVERPASEDELPRWGEMVSHMDIGTG